LYYVVPYSPSNIGGTDGGTYLSCHRIQRIRSVWRKLIS